MNNILSDSHTRKYLLVILLGLSIGTCGANEIQIDQSGSKGTTLVEIDSNNDRYNIDLQQSGIENMLDVGIYNSVTAVISQHGDFGLIDLELNGRHDLLKIDQFGLSNDLIGIFSGQNNKTFVEQQGSNNLINLDIDGLDNQFNLNQNGNNNKLQLIHNKNNDRINLNQTGDDNLMKIDHSSSNIILDVSQDGSNGSVLVTN